MLMSVILAGVIIILIAYLFDKYFIRIYDYWEKQGIPTAAGVLPFFGHEISIFWTYKTLSRFFDDIYTSNKGRSMIGFYQYRKPNLILLDPELVKKVLISDFAKFNENPLKIDPNLDPLLAQNPFFNEGEKWKMYRNPLSYALMSSKRLRILCYSVTKVCDKFMKHLRENVERSKNGVYEVDFKKLANCFTGEVVASGGFGIEGDFFINGSGPNSFHEAVADFMNTDSIISMIPGISEIFGVRFLPEKTDLFFRRVVHEMIALRKKDGIPRNDFLQLMLDNYKNNNEEIDEVGLTANAVSFFFDGYETSAIVFSFFAYLLAENPEVQEKLRIEVKTILEKYNDQINYESISEMTYMDQALNESMRLYPALGYLPKLCTERCKLVGNDGLECVIEPGTQIFIPVHAIHRDSEYWENPEIYKPERFSDEFKKERPKMAFIPFGEGPRICVGMRFALMQLKGAMATILKNFVIEVSPKLKRPLEFKRTILLTTLDGELWINIKPL